MKKLICKIISVLNQPTGKVKPSVFAAVVAIVIVLGRVANSKFVIIFGVISVLFMIPYIIMSLLKHEDIIKILSYFLIGIMGIVVVVMYYYISKGVDCYAIGVVAPVLFMSLLVLGYLNTKESGDKDKIKQMKIVLILGVPLCILIMIFFIWA